MMSVGYNFLCGRPHGADPLPLHVDVINGWPLNRS